MLCVATSLYVWILDRGAFAMNRTTLNLVSFVILLLMTTTTHAGGWLGITIEPPQGVQVGEIIKGGPADQAKLEKGDIILAINSNQVQSIPHFIQEISRLAAKQEVILTIVRQGKKMEVRVILDDSNRHLSVSQTPFFRMPTVGFHHPAPKKPGSLLPQTPTTPLLAAPGTPPAPSLAWLGIAPGISNKGGVLVKGVAPNSPGIKAGIKSGDIITAINGQAVSTPASLVRLMSQFKPDDLVMVSLIRNGKVKNLQAKMAIHPSQQ
jgi:S1-C subfamily serine protease